MATGPSDGPRPDPYTQTYNVLTKDYDSASEKTTPMLNEYSGALQECVQVMLNGAEQAYAWAKHHGRLAQIEAIKARLISDRIFNIAARCHMFAANAMAREHVDQVMPGDQNILSTSEQVEKIRQQTEDAVDRAKDASDRARTAVESAETRRDNIQRRLDQMTMPILDSDYTVVDIQKFNKDGLTKTPTDLRQANQFARDARDYAAVAHVEVQQLDQLMEEIRREGSNIGVTLP